MKIDEKGLRNLKGSITKGLKKESKPNYCLNCGEDAIVLYVVAFADVCCQ